MRVSNVIKPGDYHIIVNDWETKYDSQMTCYDSDGERKWRTPCLAKGQFPEWWKYQGDTPPGVYTLGQLTVTDECEPDHIWKSFGKYFFALNDFYKGQAEVGRAGCGIHGAGREAYQPLKTTHGCIRMYNSDIVSLLLPLYESCKGVIYVTVNQY